MSVDFLAAVEAVRIPFINWQYIYCWLASLFGARCADSAPVLPDVVPGVVIDGIQSATTSAGFWSWLWPFGSGTSADVGATASDASWFLSGVPQPLLTALDSAVHVLGPVFKFVWSVFAVVSYSIAGLLLSALVVVCVLLVLIRIKDWRNSGTLPPRPTGNSYGWSRWQDLLNAAMAPEPRRWREALVVADAMLGELLTKIGYSGMTTAEQLRTVPDGAFVTLPHAWEAHRIRNFVVQKSSNFILTQREAFRVMKLYEQVFEEFDFI